MAVKLTNRGSAPNYSVSNVVYGNRSAPIVVICDSPSPYAWRGGLPMTKDNMEIFSNAAKNTGLTRDDFCFIVPCPPVPEDMFSSDKKKGLWLEQHKEEFELLLSSLNPRAIVVSGALAARQYYGKPVKITNARGLIVDIRDKPCLPVLSTGHVARVPDMYPLLAADLLTLGRLKEADYNVGEMNAQEDSDSYEYTFDLSEVIAAKPKIIAVDTETTGLKWYTEDAYPFLVQLTYKEGHSLLIPVSDRYIPDGLNPADMPKALAQLKQIMEDETIHKVGHNFKYDIHMMRKLGIEVKGWRHDTMQMAYTVDENMRQYGLDDCVKVWLPEKAGYCDELTRNYDMANMIEVPFDVMKRYAGGDTDVCFRLCRNLMQSLRQTPDHYKRYTHIVMPSLTMFAKVTELMGVKVDMLQLENLKVQLKASELAMHNQLLREAPAKVKLNAIRGDYAKLGSPKFIREILFSKAGFGLRPTVFTKAGNEPSISTSEHLVYFEDNDWVQKYTEYVKLKKLNSTYVSDFSKYIADDGCIHPSFLLHRTNTGRVASADPNGQNFPKRGELAKQYRKMFVARDGYVIVEADYAQVELKLAAIMSGDANMLAAYKLHGDLHIKTAADTMHLTVEQFKQLDKAVQKQKRFEAKAINFGFIYGMSAEGFKVYAKTQYKIDYTTEEAEAFRNTFFRSYPSLLVWHERVKKFARDNGYVVSPHGVIRHLPSIYSKDRATQSMTERQAVNAPVQLLGSDLTLMAATRFTRDVNPDDARVILMVHDAVVMEVRADKVDEYASALKWYMENNPVTEWFGFTPEISLNAEVAIGDSYGDTEEEAGAHIQSAMPEWYDRERDLLPPLQILASM